MGMRVIDYYSVKDGIFDDFSTVAPDVVSELFPMMDMKELNLLFISSCGQKLVGPLFSFNAVGNEDITDIRLQIASLILSTYQHKWARLRAIIFSDYDPLNPYTMVNSVTQNISNDTTTTDNNSVKNSIYGFNSTDAVDKDTEEEQRESTAVGTQLKTVTSKKTGNIGNMSSQELAVKELDFIKNIFIDNVINDISKLISLDVYM